MHRDISIGNIVICADLSYNPDINLTNGRLIDLDQAKATDEPSRLYDFQDNWVVPHSLHFLENVTEPKLIARVHQRLSVVAPTAPCYGTVSRYLGPFVEKALATGNKASCKDAGWDFEVFLKS